MNSLTHDAKYDIICGKNCQLSASVAHAIFEHIHDCCWKMTHTLATMLVSSYGTYGIKHTIEKHKNDIWAIDHSNNSLSTVAYNNKKKVLDIELDMFALSHISTCGKPITKHNFLVCDDHPDVADIIFPDDNGRYWKHVCPSDSKCRMQQHPLLGSMNVKSNIWKQLCKVLSNIV